LRRSRFTRRGARAARALAARAGALVWLVALVAVASALSAALPGCTAETPEPGLSEQDRAALASLGYVADEIRQAGGRDESKKVLVLGIDGMDWLITSRLMDEGKLPHFRMLAEGGGSSPLLSSIPPQSPVAWSNFITGADPGGHGIFDFVHRDPDTYLPYLSTSKVEPAPEKAKFLGFAVNNAFAMPFTDYVFPLAGGATLNLRKGVAFWQVLEAAGVPCTIFKIPSNFPPVPSEKGLVRSISGMGTPDILGTYGTFSFYTTDPRPGYKDISGGYIYPVSVEDGTVHATLYGPPNDFKNYEKIEERQGEPVSYSEKKVGIDFEVFVDSENPVAKVVIGGEEVLLTEGEFSDWVEVEFVMVPNLVTVSGLARFYLKSAHPEFELYVTPVQINPANQVLPITDPPEYGKQLVDEVGYFYTQNMPEDTKALEHGVFDNAIFVEQSTIVFNERLACFRNELARFDEGLLYFYFGSLDQSTHMMWRCMDAGHPAYDPAEDAEFADFLENLYVKFDGVLGEVMEAIDEQTTLIVLSDHGFAPYYREFHLNRWLFDEGYLVLKPGVRPETVEWLIGVDWSKTRAYGLGINALYVNMSGREHQGIVMPGREAEGLIDEIAAKLETIVDPKTGQRIIVRAYKSSEFYHGPYQSTAPDIVVGYGWGYRGSDRTATGQIPAELVEDNLNKWSGDHCADYHHVPGVLFANRPIAHEAPSLYDMAPTVLAEFGIAKRSWMVGTPVFD
jgi:predicted AlkP superfamily phosphohydrolase/phosphomutase